MRGLLFTRAAWTELGQQGRATFLFRPRGKLSPAAARYVEVGKASGVDRAYKCRVRSPWWLVPFVPPAHLLLTYMNADTPRLCANQVGAHHLNSVHGVYLNEGLRELGMALLPLAALNSASLAAAETVGRAYGGGMLKLEPKEADRLPVPAPPLVEAAAERLAALRPQTAQSLRGGTLFEAVRLVDDVLLIGELGMRRSEVRALREAHSALRARRTARGADPRDAVR